jgi:hypothetical protein
MRIEMYSKQSMQVRSDAVVQRSAAGMSNPPMAEFGPGSLVRIAIYRGGRAVGDAA